MIVVVVEVLCNENFKFDVFMFNIMILEEVFKKLEFLKEIEIYNQLQWMIVYVKGEEVLEDKILVYNYLIDWVMLDDLVEDWLVIININCGVIIFEMLFEFVFGIVVNFIVLVWQGFYQDKVIYWVVFNFVLQGGCFWGDGYGSLDYIICFELFLFYYDEVGYVGMVLVGNYMECIQFFIIYSFIFYLDGEYIIFVCVIDGLEVVY